MVRQYNANMAWQQAQAARSSSGGGGGGGSRGGGGSGTPTPSEKSVEEVYIEAKKNGAKATELDNYLKQCISEGRISLRDATDLREKRW